jgi:hypothetical protein
MELVIVPAVLFVGWRPGRRRALLVCAVVLYFITRVWTYLVYAQRRTETATGPLTAADVRWYRESLVVDYRVVVLAVVLALFAAAAFLPARAWIGRTLER